MAFPFSTCLLLLVALSLITGFGARDFDVMDYGAVGNGESDDTQVMFCKFLFWFFLVIHRYDHIIIMISIGFHESLEGCVQGFIFSDIVSCSWGP